jgi:hypothetical protein
MPIKTAIRTFPLFVALAAMPGLPKWPQFDAASRPYLSFTDEGPVAKEGLRRQFCNLFIESVKEQMRGKPATAEPCWTTTLDVVMLNLPSLFRS